MNTDNIIFLALHEVAGTPMNMAEDLAEQMAKYIDAKGYALVPKEPTDFILSGMSKRLPNTDRNTLVRAYCAAISHATTKGSDEN